MPLFHHTKIIVGLAGLGSVFFFFNSILWCNESGDCPEENLVKFGYKPDMKGGSFCMLGNPTSHRSMAIWNFIFSSSDEFVPFLTWKTLFISQNHIFHFGNLLPKRKFTIASFNLGISAANACLALKDFMCQGHFPSPFLRAVSPRHLCVSWVLSNWETIRP
jgi:hypothetical protein